MLTKKMQMGVLSRFFFTAAKESTPPAFWPAVLLRRTSVFARGENLGAGRIHFAQALKYQKVEPPFGCPLVLGSVDKIDTMIKRKHKYGRSKLNLNRKVF